MPTPLALYNVAALRAIEARVAASLGDDFALMQRAGAAAWREVLAHWPRARRIAVACGPGNNGGDGYVLARHALESGRELRVLQLQPPRTGPAQRACEEFVRAGGGIETGLPDFAGCDLVVDALFGIGLSRAPEGEAVAWIDTINGAGIPMLAIDVPSGVDAEHGSVPGKAIRATHTLECIAPKAGLRTGAAQDHAGELSLATLEAPASAFDDIEAAAEWFDADGLGAFLPKRRRDSHKGDNGRVLCIGGDLGMGGAVLLCAEAALRGGAGLVRVATREAHVAPLLARCPEAMPAGIEDSPSFASMLEQADVLALGPGLGQGEWGRALFFAAISAGKPLVVDADALNLLAQSPRTLSDAILTPHPGEAARLLGCSNADIQRDRIAAAMQLAEKFDAVVVLKGAGSVVAAPKRIPRVIGAGNPGMAVGGMGDVLTGIIAALRAQGLEAFDAATAGALLHAVAGDDAAREGERGLLPRDVIACVRRAANAGESAHALA
ncbi:MAG: NAD(P)H-hydrate dehydratase [Thermomonas sp.]